MNAIYIYIQKIIQVFSGILTIYFITYYTTTQEQGYYFIIANVINTILFFDLGINSLIVQEISRKFNLNIIGKTRYSINKNIFLNLYYIKSVYKVQLFKVKILLILTPFLFVLAENIIINNSNIYWEVPLLIAILFAILSLLTNLFISIIEGSGDIKCAYFLRGAYYSIGAILTWVLLYNGEYLYAASSILASLNIIILIFFIKNYSYYFMKILRINTNLLYKKQFVIDIKEFQKKSFVVYFTNYLLLNIPSIIGFYYLGPIESGRLSLSIIACNLLGSLASSLFIAKTPVFSNLISLNKINDTRLLFKSQIKIQLIFLLIGYTIFLFVNYVLNIFNINTRFIQFESMIALMIMFTAYYLLDSIRIYFKLNGKDFFSYHIVLILFISTLASCILVSFIGIFGIIIPYSLIYVFGIMVVYMKIKI
jgi:hypothetical protein